MLGGTETRPSSTDDDDFGLCGCSRCRALSTRAQSHGAPATPYSLQRCLQGGRSMPHARSGRHDDRRESGVTNGVSSPAGASKRQRLRRWIRGNARSSVLSSQLRAESGEPQAEPQAGQNGLLAPSQNFSFESKGHCPRPRPSEREGATLSRSAFATRPPAPKAAASRRLRSR